MIGCGYADGLFRALNSQGVIHVGDHRAPIVGRVSMDLLSIDVGCGPFDLAQPGMITDIADPHQDSAAPARWSLERLMGADL